MNIPEPYRLYFPPMRQERYYPQLLSWSYERPNPYGNLVPQDIYAADNNMQKMKASYKINKDKKYPEAFAMNDDNIQKVNGASYQISENKRYAEPFAFSGSSNGEIISPSANEFFAADDFENVAGKGKLCRQAGLTGAEKRACKQNIKSKCGRKPRGFLGLKGARKRELQEKWAKCAQEMVVTPEQSAKELAEDIVPTTREEGLSTGAKVMISVAVVGTLTLIGFAVAAKMRKPAMVAQQVPPVASPVMRTR